jgi:hypothetical protein
VGLRLATVALLTLLARGALAEDPIYVASTAPFSEPLVASREEVDDCELPERTIEFIRADAKRAGIDLVVDDGAVAAKKGRLLQVEIAGVDNSGNWFWGHAKEMAVKGRLLNDGTEVGSFHFRRSSIGGIFGKFMSSCSVMLRCADALGDNVAKWLQNPVPDAH